MSDGDIEREGSIAGVPDPRAHDFLFGHEDARRAIEAAFSQNRFPQAWLISGKEGVGKATLAWRYARQLVETGAISSGFTANQDMLDRYQRGSHLQITELSLPDDGKGGFKNQIPIESVRKLSEKLSLAETDGRWRAVIIDPADAMNRAAANAILKLLEEPPARMVFFLLTSAPSKLLPTIRSRCQFLRLGGLDEGELEGALEVLGQKPNAERLLLAEGSVRMAILLEGALFDDYCALLDALLAPPPRERAFIGFAAQLSKEGRNPAYLRAKQVFSFLYGRIARIHFGTLEGREAETLIAQKLPRAAMHKFASAGLECFAALETGMALNLDPEVEIFRQLSLVDDIINFS